MSNVGSNYYDNIAQKRYSTIVSWIKLGFNPEIKNVSEDLIPQGGVYTFPASATKMDIVSANDNDGKTGSPTSTGARTVTVYGLLANGTEASETITMNGTTPVQTANTYLRINNMRIATVGSNFSTVGDISLSETGGTTYKYGYIRAGYTRQRTLVYTIPAGKTLYVTSTTLSAVCGASGHWTRFTFRATYDDKSDTVLPAGFYMPYFETSIVESAFERHFVIPIRLPAGTDIKISAICDGTVTMICESILRGYITTP